MTRLSSEREGAGTGLAQRAGQGRGAKGEPRAKPAPPGSASPASAQSPLPAQRAVWSARGPPDPPGKSGVSPRHTNSTDLGTRSAIFPRKQRRLLTASERFWRSACALSTSPLLCACAVRLAPPRVNKRVSRLRSQVSPTRAGAGRGGGAEGTWKAEGGASGPGRERRVPQAPGGRGRAPPRGDGGAWPGATWRRWGPRGPTQRGSLRLRGVIA